MTCANFYQKFYAARKLFREYADYDSLLDKLLCSLQMFVIGGLEVKILETVISKTAQNLVFFCLITFVRKSFVILRNVYSSILYCLYVSTKNWKYFSKKSVFLKIKHHLHNYLTLYTSFLNSKMSNSKVKFANWVVCCGLLDRFVFSKFFIVLIDGSCTSGRKPLLLPLVLAELNVSYAFLVFYYSETSNGEVFKGVTSLCTGYKVKCCTWKQVGQSEQKAKEGRNFCVIFCMIFLYSMFKEMTKKVLRRSEKLF